MGFTFGRAVVRERARLVVDPYSQLPRPAGWDDPVALDIEGAFVASSSSAATQSATRTEVLTAKSLYCDPSADVRAGDRIRDGSHLYVVEAVPEADVNPFTGWQPVQEIPLKEVTG